MALDKSEYPHRRFNPLTGEWVLVSPHRTRRPWQGGQAIAPAAERPVFDPECYLCPGNLRANGARNPVYKDTFVFVNDFAAVLPDAPDNYSGGAPLLQAKPVQGEARVICYSPRHDLTLARMSAAEIALLVDLWAQQTADLGRRYQWVQVFENRGELMGASNPHPHGQIWATSELGNIPAAEDRHQRAYYERHGRVMLLDYAELEAAKRERLVLANETWVALVPYWAIWPYETLLLPRDHCLRLPDLDAKQRCDLAGILKRLLIRYDNLFEVSFPYSMGWHGAPFAAGDQSHWQLHAHFYPPLLRSATVKKFMVGYEMLAEAQRDITAEQAAAKLRKLSDQHYTLR